MNITSDYSITKLFITKDVRVIIDKVQFFTIHLKTVRDFYMDNDWNAVYHIWTASPEKFKKSLGFKEEKTFSSFEILTTILFNLGRYDKFRNWYNLFLKVLEEIIPNVQIKNQQIIIGNITITDDIWEYILYLLKLSCGEKAERPLSFSSEEARQFYLAQKAYEEKIKAVKATKQGDIDGLMKGMLSIVYKFPSFTIDYLFDQTMAQIQWLQKYAAGAVSYEVNAKAFAAGNMKKGKKLDFFIK